MYRKLTCQEIESLKAQHCSAENWDNILVSANFNPKNINHTHFSGNITLGVFEKEVTLPGGIRKSTGLNRVSLCNCEIEDNVLIENVQNYIANYKIGENSIICNLDVMYVEGRSTFGNGVEAAVLNESGGREVMINDKLSAQYAYILALYRHRPALIKRMQDLIHTYAEKYASEIGSVGKNVKIINVGSIKNVRIGDDATIEGSCRLENGSINSNKYDPIYIGYKVVCEDFIISSGSKVEDGVMLKRCFIGQACHLGFTYSATDSLFFSNCQGENGEACAIFAGPYTVTHHKSTLLIAGMFSFMNAGSGSNQSNHMYKLGPIHQGIVERGGKTTSDSYILWPAKIGAFSLIMGRHYRNSDTSDMPFSYLIESGEDSVLVPAANLKSVGTIRDAQKFPKRDKRKDPNKLDQLNFNLLSPYTIQKMVNAVDILEELQKTCGKTSETYTYQSYKIGKGSLEKGIKLYRLAITKFLGNSLISRLENKTFNNDEEVRKCLKPGTEIGLGDWSDIAGLLAPKKEIDKLIDNIESGNINRVGSINDVISELHQNYYTYEWTWSWDKIEKYFGISLQTVTSKKLIEIIEKWKEAVISIDRMLYEDAKKEFSLTSQIGFGADGSREEQNMDFEQVRGAFEKNTFVRSILEHIEKKTELGNSVINQLKFK